MIEKIMLPLTLMFGVLLYFTRDAGMDFTKASSEHRAAFADRQTRAWVSKAGLTPVFRSELVRLETRDNSNIVIVHIRLGSDTTLVQKRQETYARACTAYMNSRLAEFAITQTVRFESDTGALKANFTFKPSRCAKYAPAPV